MPPRTLKIVLAYDGSDFVGWQRQRTGPSVQARLEEALASIEGRAVTVHGAGRTDAGVHALGQVASCHIEHQLPPARLTTALNAMLPRSVRVLRVEEAPDSFHARYSARVKTYRYLVINDEIVSPFEQRYAWHIPQRLDTTTMIDAARVLEGEHDFAALQGARSAIRTTVRTVTAATVRESTTVEVVGGSLALPDRAAGARFIVIEMSGTGFLRHMVRNAVGTLVEIGRGRHAAGWMADVLESRDRSQAGPTAPAAGLFLVGVDY